MSKFLLIVFSKQDPIEITPTLTKLRHTVSHLEIFQQETFQPPRRILITDKTCGTLAELFKESFVDLFQTHIRIPNIPEQEVSQTKLVESILNSDADIVFVVSNHPLEDVIRRLNPKVILPRERSGVCLYDIKNGEVCS